MKVIILEDERVENVSDGYARNYLLPRKLAVPATPQAVAAAEKRREKKKAEMEQKKAEMQQLADKLSALEIEIPADAGEEGKLFGSITAADIAEAVKSAAGVEIDKKKIEIADPIKALGEHQASVKLFPEVKATLKIKISAR